MPSRNVLSFSRLLVFNGHSGFLYTLLALLFLVSQGYAAYGDPLPGSRPTHSTFSAPSNGQTPLILQDSIHDARSLHRRNQLSRGELPLPDQKDPASSLVAPAGRDWRLKISGSAVAAGANVRLSEIADPIGPVPDWESLKDMELWPAPPEPGKPLQINRSNLAQALNERLGRDISSHCILPTSIVIQRGGVVVREDALRTYVVKSLTPLLRNMPGEVDFSDFHLPPYIFLAHEGQRIQLEEPKLRAGRVALRFAIIEADGNVLRRISGSITLAQWVTVPTAARNLSKGESLTPDAVTFSRINARRLKDAAWDGKGGPWQLMRTLSAGEPILQTDLATEYMVRRGDIVTLIFSRGNLHLQTQAEALADGEPGSTISVRNLQTRKQVFATVKDGKTVVIH
ncbi:MAG: flagellar basal body P-ring formation chaperone FlgA [Desulfovibrio sp.]|nr:flagellar basal body P-ring formation chaperone FlgA [Desulfovibrio sp.]